jgi:hypothetical protein
LDGSAQKLTKPAEKTRHAPIDKTSLGVVAAIIPLTSPLLIAAIKMAPALFSVVRGNCIRDLSVIKLITTSIKTSIPMVKISRFGWL